MVLILQKPVYCQKNDVRTVFIHVDTMKYNYTFEVAGYSLRYEDDTIEWQSDLLQPIVKDDQGLLFKVVVPQTLINPDIDFNCFAHAVIKDDTPTWIWTYPTEETDSAEIVSIPYAGVNLSQISLEIISDPPGAEVFLIPNRIWLQNYKDIGLNALFENKEQLEEFRVNSSLTNTSVIIDQTVFKVLFRLNENVQTLTHFTRPESVEKNQQIFIKFE